MLAWAMCCCVVGLLAQEEPIRYQIKSFGEDEGLSVQGITPIVQDAYGFIWVGSSKGLTAFDGMHSRDYALPGERVEGFYNRVTALTVDAEGELWFGTKDGIYNYHHPTEQMVLLEADGMPEVASVSVLQFAPDGRLWAIINGQLCAIDLKAHRLEVVGDGLVSPTCMTVARNGQVWLGDMEGVLYRYDARVGRFRSYRVQPAEMERWGEIRAITEMGDGRLAVTTAVNGACLFSLERLESVPLFDRDDEGSPVVAHTAMSPDGVTLMVGSERGILMFNVKSHRMVCLRQSHNLGNTLSDNAVHALYLGREHGVWVGTYFGGVNRVSVDVNSFMTYIPDGDVDVMREMCKDQQGRLWIGAEDGDICLFDREQGAFVPAGIVWGSHPVPYNIQAMILVGNDLWASTLTNGIYVIDLATKQVKKRYTRTNPTETGRPLQVNCLCCQQGTVFAGTRNGMYIFDPETESFNQVLEMGDIYSHRMFADREGNVWMASFDSGLWKLSPRQGGGWQVEHTPFAYRCCTTVMEDSDGDIWVGTDRRGLMRYHPADGTSSQLEVSARLSRQMVSNLMEDGNKCLWISTFDGLYSYEKKTGKVTHFTTRNGLPSKFLNYASGYADAEDGMMYIGTYNGLMRFMPSSFRLSNEKLRPYFLDLTVNGNRIVPNDSTGILKTTLMLTKELNLTYAQSTFAISYAAPSYRVGQVVWYRYRLNPEDPWIVVDNAQVLQLNNLSVGDYELSMQASYDPDVWNGETAVLYIHVSPPAWMNGWAILIYLIIVVVLTVVFLMIWWNRQERRRLEESLAV